MALILDTGVLYAAADADDDWHERSRNLLESEPGLRIVPVTVIPEVCYLLHDRLGSIAERSFLRSLGTELAVEPLLEPDLSLARELLEAAPRIGFVDASVLAIASRLRVARVATTDRRDFASIRLPSGFQIELLP